MLVVARGLGADAAAPSQPCVGFAAVSLDSILWYGTHTGRVSWKQPMTLTPCSSPKTAILHRMVMDQSFAI
jgi:hypothetical protein